MLGLMALMALIAFLASYAVGGGFNPHYKVYVASRDIVTGSTVKQGDFKLQDVAVPASTVTNLIGGGEEAFFKGRVTIHPILSGSFATKDALVNPAANGKIMVPLSFHLTAPGVIGVAKSLELADRYNKAEAWRGST